LELGIKTTSERFTKRGMPGVVQIEMELAQHVAKQDRGARPCGEPAVEAVSIT
jgi:hypothetical protein